jgi:hypothetical protein
VPAFPAGNYGFAVVDGTGTATVTVIGPRRIGTYWQIGQVILKGTPAGGSTGCNATVYRGAAIPSAVMGSSLIANADTLMGGIGDQLFPGDQLVVVATGLTPATRYYVTLFARELDAAELGGV